MADNLRPLGGKHPRHRLGEIKVLGEGAVDQFVTDNAPRLKEKGVLMNLLDPGWLRTDLGGPNAPGAVESVLPGALVPALLTDGTAGKLFRAQDWAGQEI